jgi:hypothetical protein
MCGFTIDLQKCFGYDWLMRTAIRCIPKTPKSTIWYLVDACFLVNKFFNEKRTRDRGEIDSITAAKQYWEIIDQQLAKGQCRIFLLDVCIAEAFKVLAKKRYQRSSLIRTAKEYNRIASKMSKELSLSSKEAKRTKRTIKYHDLQTCRDIIIGVDRFFEATYKRGGAGLGTIDLMLLSAGKYLMDFYGFSRSDLFMITQDRALYKIARSMNDLPKTFNPQESRDNFKKVFVTDVN